MSTFSYHPNYLSTACHHGQHFRCSVDPGLSTCEFCNTPCTCECHEKAKRDPPPQPDDDWIDLPSVECEPAEVTP
jgi:hypothetical protein